jgi:hypothetical protein
MLNLSSSECDPTTEISLLGASKSIRGTDQLAKCAGL